MGTTLTLDDDVAATLDRLRRSRCVSLKHLINEALRRGLNDMSRRRRPREQIRTRAVVLGGERHQEAGPRISVRSTIAQICQPWLCKALDMNRRGVRTPIGMLRY